MDQKYTNNKNRHSTKLYEGLTGKWEMFSTQLCNVMVILQMASQAKKLLVPSQLRMHSLLGIVLALHGQ